MDKLSSDRDNVSTATDVSDIVNREETAVVSRQCIPLRSRLPHAARSYKEAPPIYLHGHTFITTTIPSLPMQMWCRGVIQALWASS